MTQKEASDQTHYHAQRGAGHTQPIWLCLPEVQEITDGETVYDGVLEQVVYTGMGA